MKFRIPRIGWEMDNEGDLVKENGEWIIRTTDHGGGKEFPVRSSRTMNLLDHLKEMKSESERAIALLETVLEITYEGNS